MAKAKKSTRSKEVPIDRRKGKDQRTTKKRRQKEEPVKTERRTSTRRMVARRRQIDPTTCERDYTGDEIEFMRALDEYKRANGRMFPTCSEILEVIRKLGYERSDTEALTPESGTTGDSSEPTEESKTSSDDDLLEVEV